MISRGKPLNGLGPDRPAPREEELPVVGPGGRLEIGLEHMRYRHLSWMGIGLVVGSLLVWKLGTVGVWVGVVLLVVGAIATYSFVRTLMFPPGTIAIDDGVVELPRGLCKGPPATFKLAEVAHAYLLRRAVPWTRAAPVLVIEAGGRAFSYPRDWFMTEADQRRVVRDLNSRGAGRASEGPGAGRASETATPVAKESA